jgi:hypothetical protein
MRPTFAGRFCQRGNPLFINDLQGKFERIYKEFAEEGTRAALEVGFKELMFCSLQFDIEYKIILHRTIPLELPLYANGIK